MQMRALALTVAMLLGRAAFAQIVPAAPDAPPESAVTSADPMVPSGLGDLEKTTFACPKAALNAAAREASAQPSRGTYQFSYFNIISGAHHAAYEVHFRSNHAADPVLRFCVVNYCQQGFDPTRTTTVTLLGATAAAHRAPTGHVADACHPPRARRGAR